MSNHVPGGMRGRSRYGMDYIPDRALFAAVMFARKMIREGLPAGIANHRAANYYGVSTHDVAHYVGQVGATCARRRRRN